VKIAVVDEEASHGRPIDSPAIAAAARTGARSGALRRSSNGSTTAIRVKAAMLSHGHMK
jgi:hypothetical protein